ncbi:serine hydrolase [Candidatus Daviesbacteria bacterium]|nr:serine hydrolase [Candidatus Daviesbacteria bacterium]
MRKIFPILALFLVILLLFLGTKGIPKNKFSIELIGHRSNLEEMVAKSLENSAGTYAMAIKNLKSGEEYYQEADRIFPAGSLYKLGTMLATLEQIEEGEIREDEVISGDVSQINRILGISDEEAEVKQDRIDFTIENALRQMIAISHNYAAVLLTEKVGVNKAQEAVNRLGLVNTKIDTTDKPETTARDMLTFFEKVYKREGVSVYTSSRIISLLLQQELNDRIPKYLPKEAKVAHKTGEIDFAKHDAGIVFANSGDYLIVVLSESDNPSAASERIANLSKAVYEYFSKKN